MVAVGTMVWLASELMFFAALFAAYFTIRSVTNNTTAGDPNGTMWQQGSAMLNVPLALANTIILVLSSVTCQMGVFAAERGDVKKLRFWYILTFIMGSVFIGGQVYEYAQLWSEGMTMQSNVYGSLFFLATGFHGLHVTAGLIAFIYVLARTYMARQFTHEQAVSAVAVSYYWHFVDVVWIVLFSVIYFMR
uniref:aa3-type cytochrome oxidase subunit III n=1 Tax=Enemella evansiae TaxID=2016499 RepID=UPI001060EF3D|nr:heme-copper oxidase subunit III [Enemella evansiae]